MKKPTEKFLKMKHGDKFQELDAKDDVEFAAVEEDGTLIFYASRVLDDTEDFLPHVPREIFERAFIGHAYDLVQKSYGVIQFKDLQIIMKNNKGFVRVETI